MNEENLIDVLRQENIEGELRLTGKLLREETLRARGKFKHLRKMCKYKSHVNCQYHGRQMTECILERCPFISL